MVGPRTERLISLIITITNKYGGSIYDYEANKSWDAGQAVCREMYGADWMNSAAFQSDQELDDVPHEAVATAKRMLEQKPDWMTDKEA